MKRKFSIKSMLILFTLFIVIVLSGSIGALSIYSLYNVQGLAVERDFRKVGEQFSSKIDNYLSPIYNSSEFTNTFFQKYLKSIEDKKRIDNIISESTIRNDILDLFASTLKTDQNVVMMYIADTKGNLLMKKRMPDDSLANRLVIRKKNSVEEVWEYFDPDGEKSVERESSSLKDGYSPAIRPWYRLAINEKKPAWTDIYVFKTTGQPGITFTFPIYYKNKLYGVVGVDISLQNLSSFLTKKLQESTYIYDKNTQLFIVYKEKIIATAWNLSDIGKKVTDNPIINNIYQYYRTNDVDSGLFQIERHNADDEKINYFSYFKTFSKDKTITDPDKLFYIGLFSPEHIIMKDINEFALMILYFMLGSSIIAVILSLVLVHKFSKQLLLVENNLTHLREFNFDNVEHIDSSFRQMDSINERIQALLKALLSLSKFVPKAIEHNILTDNQEATNAVEKKRLAIFFSDIADFANITEGNPPESLLHHLERYFTTCIDVIDKNYGTVDKTIFDTIMVLWNAPEDIEDYEYLACLSAIEMQQALNALNDEFEKEGFPRFETRIGIHIDDVLVGTIGHKDKLSYTAIGNGVSIAQRLEATNKVIGTNTLISKYTYDIVQDRIVCMFVGQIALEGVSEKMPIYTLLGIREELEEEEIEMAEFHNKVMAKINQLIASNIPNKKRR